MIGKDDAQHCTVFIWNPWSDIFVKGMMEGIASMHSWIKAQTMIRSAISCVNSIKNVSKLKKSKDCFVRITARPTKLGKKGELGGEEEDEEEDITILLTSRWKILPFCAHQGGLKISFFLTKRVLKMLSSNPLMGEGTSQN